MKPIFLVLIILTCLLVAQESQRQQIIMGTFATISLEEKHKKELQKGFKLLKKIEESLSSYGKEALLYQLNQEKKIKADDYLLEAIDQSQKIYALSNGYFNIAIGSVTKDLYHFGEEEKIPSKKALNNANTQIKGIHITKNLIKLNKNTTLDLGGMGKGFAVDKVANYYREKNISHGIISLSGDIQILHPSTVYLDSPFQNQKPFAKLQTLHSNTSVSTSGTYRRYVKTKKYHHLINPKTKKQGRSFVSITLITKQNNTLIDAMATAIGVMSEEEALDFLVNNPHIGYVLVRPNGNVIYGNITELALLIFI